MVSRVPVLSPSIDEDTAASGAAPAVQLMKEALQIFALLVWTRPCSHSVVRSSSGGREIQSGRPWSDDSDSLCLAILMNKVNAAHIQKNLTRKSSGGHRAKRRKEVKT
jgi:hypothetical protein